MVTIRPYTSRLSADMVLTVPRPEHLIEKRFGSAEVATGDALFEHPDVAKVMPNPGIGAR
ncbi:MAG: hypothetical protein JWR37_699 [Mycobacterium sp.]|nr:hypothetical protein [Mycobacterium sp.]